MGYKKWSNKPKWLMPDIRVHPSLLASDFANLGGEAKRCADAGADQLHLDVMDGHFVPNLSMGPAVVAAVRRSTDIPLDVHLMIYNPYDFIEPFVEAGANSITIHFEATESVADTLAYIRRCNCKAGLAFSPETSAEFALKYLDQCDMILLMTVHPGFGGQGFMPEVLDKIRFVRESCEKLNIDLDIQVDGGIDDQTAAQCKKAGANVFVAGTYLFKQPDLEAAITRLRNS